MNIALQKHSMAYQTSLQAKLYVHLIVLTITKTQHDKFVVMDNFDNTNLIGNCIRHPSSQHNYLDKLLISTIVHQIL